MPRKELDLTDDQLLAATVAALALVKDEERFDEAEIEDFLATNPTPSPETEAALRALGPDLAQRIMRGETGGRLTEKSKEPHSESRPAGAFWRVIDNVLTLSLRELQKSLLPNPLPTMGAEPTNTQIAEHSFEIPPLVVEGDRPRTLTIGFQRAGDNARVSFLLGPRELLSKGPVRVKWVRTKKGKLVGEALLVFTDSQFQVHKDISNISSKEEWAFCFT